MAYGFWYWVYVRGCTPTCVDVTFVWRSWYVGQEADVTNKWLDTASFRRHEISASTKSGPTQFVGYRDAESVLKMHGLTVSHLVPPMDDRTPLRISVTWNKKYIVPTTCLVTPWSQVWRLVNVFFGSRVRNSETRVSINRKKFEIRSLAIFCGAKIFNLSRYCEYKILFVSLSLYRLGYLVDYLYMDHSYKIFL